MPDDKALELLRAIAGHVQLKITVKGDKKRVQVELFTDEGVHIGNFIDSANYKAGRSLFSDLAAAKRYIEIEDAKPKLKTVPRLKRVK